jgi:CheY-like chemotaxis protein
MSFKIEFNNMSENKAVENAENRDIKEEIENKKPSEIGIETITASNKGQAVADSPSLRKHGKANNTFEAALVNCADSKTKALTLSARPLRILVAEDNKLNQILIERIKSTEFTIELAVDGQEAVNKVKAGSYALIFMDLCMPNMNGAEATREIRLFNQSIPIIIQSDSPENEVEEIFKDLSVQGSLHKKLKCLQQVEETIAKLKCKCAI